MSDFDEYMKTLDHGHVNFEDLAKTCFDLSQKAEQLTQRVKDAEKGTRNVLKEYGLRVTNAEIKAQLYREALEKYGRHDPDCSSNTTHDKDCDCGLGKALSTNTTEGENIGQLLLKQSLNEDKARVLDELYRGAVVCEHGRGITDYCERCGRISGSVG